MIKYKPILLLSFFLAAITRPALAAEWDFLDVQRIGAADFIKAHPQWNGQDAVIVILDTGVDMGVPGLNELPDGGIKVIDVQDFSGEGDVALEKAVAGQEGNEFYLKNTSRFKLYGYRQLPQQPPDSVYYIGVLDEDRFKNSPLPDINNNDKNSDRFGVVVFKSDSGWMAYVDLDGDGNLTDETALFSYKEKLQSFQFRGRDEQRDRNLATFALNIFPDEPKVVFHYDGSSHGTHVAGIAAGYKINGQDGLNGIAPGAKIISLKIGDNRLAGGSTTSGSMQAAYEYGIEFAKSYDGPVVFNMSFGIGSETEGHSEMDYLIDDWLKENEKLLFCLSAGNEGPGISSVGLPAASGRALTVGALNTARVARNVYGANINEDKMFVFSSRGGEINKPDIITPGGALSTIPPFNGGDVKWGTSMASPQAAGAVALLMSAAWHQEPRLPVHGGLIKRAIVNSATLLPQYLMLEQGGGVINVPKAFDFYKQYISQNYQHRFIEYDINTVSPVYETGNGPAAYWRFGSYLPDDTDKQIFYVDADLPKEMSADEQNRFFRSFDLVASAPWIKINKSEAYIKGTKAANIEVYYDRERLAAPGIYNGKIFAYRKDSRLSGREINKEFELMCTVIRPLHFDEGNQYRWDSGPISIEKGNVKRLFFEIPFRAASAAITARTVASDYAQLSAYLFDPDGHESDHGFTLSSKNEHEEIIRLSKTDLQAGIWELDLYADFRNERTSRAEISIVFAGLQADPEIISEVRIEAGSEPRGKFRIMNQYDGKVTARLSGQISGIEKVHYLSPDTDLFEHAFKVSDQYQEVRFELKIERNIYNKFTDFAVNIKDESGKILLAEGLSYRKLNFKFIPPASGEYFLELLAAFTSAEDKNWSGSLKETFVLFKKLAINGSSEDFYPGVSREVDFKIDGQLPVAPDGYYLSGEIWLDQRGADRLRTVIPINLYTGMNN